MRELSTFTGYLALNAGRLVALAAALFILATCSYFHTRMLISGGISS